MYIRIVHSDKILDIKFSKKFPNKRIFEKSSILIKYKTDKDDVWNFHKTLSKFETIEEIISYFINNQDSNYLKVKVLELI